MSGRSSGAGAARLLRIEKSFHKVVESITSELALEPLLTLIIRHACDLLEVPIGSIGLFDAKANGIRITATHGIGRKRIGRVMGPGMGLAGRVLLARKPLVEENYRSLAGAWREIADHNVMGVPIFRRRRLLGFFGLGVKPPRRFSERDVALLCLVARHAAIAIENAQRFEEQRRRMERLSLITRVSQTIAAGLELDDLLDRTVKAIRSVLGYVNVGLALIDPEQPETMVIRAIGGRHAKVLSGLRMNISQGITGAAVRERAIQLIPDVRLDPKR